jgi:hypothetical protein
MNVCHMQWLLANDCAEIVSIRWGLGSCFRGCHVQPGGRLVSSRLVLCDQSLTTLPAGGMGVETALPQHRPLLGSACWTAAAKLSGVTNCAGVGFSKGMLRSVSW